MDRMISGFCDFLCISVHALKEKQLELLTPNLVHVYSMAEPRHLLTLRSKGQKSRSQATKCAASVGLHVNMTV